MDKSSSVPYYADKGLNLSFLVRLPSLQVTCKILKTSTTVEEFVYPGYTYAKSTIECFT